jgi:hypothetical protein
MDDDLQYFVDDHPLSRREATVVYEFAKALSSYQGPTPTDEIMDIIVQYYD